MYSTRQFHVNRNGKLLTAEASDLRLRFDQIYPDSCDQGITLVSHVTGSTSKWAVTHVEIRNEDLEYWELQPTAESVRNTPALSGFKMRILND